MSKECSNGNRNHLEDRVSGDRSVGTVTVIHVLILYFFNSLNFSFADACTLAHIYMSYLDIYVLHLNMCSKNALMPIK